MKWLSVGAIVVSGVTGALFAELPRAQAGDVAVYAGGQAFNVPVTSYKERRYLTVVKQKYDFSCGSAAIATLLTFQLHQPTTETEVFKAMWSAGDRAKIEKQGFSLLDMKNYLATRGLAADGYRVTLDKLAEVGVPAIVVISVSGYHHFVVIKGIRGNEVVVGDPALGVKVYDREKFAKLLATDIFFVIHSDMEAAREGFNQGVDWSVRTRAPLGGAVGRDSLSTYTLFAPQNQF
jgi:uncharacterized protein